MRHLNRAAPKGTATTGAEASETERTTATKLGVELAKWGKLDVEGLSQSTLTWIVGIIVGAVLIACCVGIFVERNSHGNSPPVITVIIVTMIAGAIAYFLFRSRLQPFSQAESVVLTSRSLTDNMSASFEQQATDIARLKKALAAASDTSATPSALGAKEEILREQERDLTRRARQAEIAISNSARLNDIIQKQREELLQVRYDRTVIWAVVVAGTTLVALGLFFFFSARERRRYESRQEREARREWEMRREWEARREWEPRREEEPRRPESSHIVLKGERGELRLRGVPLSPELVLRLVRDLNEPRVVPERASG
jgi:beta-lactamase regulating signal transducer with metallopeptidase domain